MILFFLWSCLMSHLAGGLGQDSFDDRQAVSAALVATHPLSLPVTLAGLSSSNPEVRLRCEKIVGKTPAVLVVRRWTTLAFLDLLTRDEYPVEWHDKAQGEDWKEFELFAEESGLYDPKRDRWGEGIRGRWLFVLWGRAKAVRYGLDPKIGNPEPPWIRPGHEPKKPE